MEFLGFGVDSISLSFALPRDKIRNVRKERQTSLNSPLVTVRQLAKLLGHLTSTIQAAFPGPLHFRRFQNEKNRALAHSHTYDSTTRCLLRPKRNWCSGGTTWKHGMEKLWFRVLWLSNRDRCLPTRVGGILQRGVHGGSMVPREISFPHKLSRTSGWGICCQDLCEWQSANASPLVNGQFDCRPLHKQDGGHKIPCSGTSGIRSMGVVPSPQYPHRGSVSTRGTKYPSWPAIRLLLDPHDWKLDPLLFAELNQVWDPLEVDLFASRLSTQLPRFYSWRPDPCSEAMDTLSQDWSKVRGYAFPPFALIGRCLRQLLDQHVSHLVLVAPVWQSQPWYPLLPELCVAPPILSPPYPGLLTRQGEVHTLLTLQLAGWLLSASHIRKHAFHDQLKPYLLQPGGMEHPRPMHQHGEDRIAGVENGNLIRFKLLSSPF